MKSKQLRELQGLLAVARGEEPADLLLHNGQVVNVFTGEVRRASVAVRDGLIAGVGQEYSKARQTVDLAGACVVPGFIDSHIHIESSLLAVNEFARVALMHGTTAVVADPHEIANVLGVAGVRYILKASEGLPLDVFVMVPSCVPATGLETGGARLAAADVAKLLRLERVIGLAEMMNYPGVAFGDPAVLAKVLSARELRRPVDGHAPGLTGAWLQAYLAAGVGSDHECFGPREALEKLRSGMRIQAREGSAARNLSSLLPVMNDLNLRRWSLVTDDRHPEELLHDGHLDAILRRAVASGMHPASAVQLVTLNPAEHYRLDGRGAIAPGYIADLVVVGELPRFNVRMVFKRGQLVVRDRELLVKLPTVRDRSVTGTVRMRRLTAGSFAIRAEGEFCNVIRLVPDQIITEKHVQQPTVARGMVVADAERDLLKLAVVERHRRTGRIGLGLVHGFGLKKGALATTVAHDSHNIIVVGTNDKDMLVAVRALEKMGGGLVAAAGGKVAASLALPIAGLMSDKPAERVVESLRQLLGKTRVWGSRPDNPFVTLSFLALPVIPELKLTDRGLVDVSKFDFINLFCKG